MTPRARSVAGAALAAIVAVLGLWLLRDRSGGAAESPMPRSTVVRDAGPVEAGAPAEAKEEVAAPSGPDVEVGGPLRGTVVDAAGAPAPGATVRLGAHAATADAAGAFSLPAPAWSAAGSGGTLVASKEGHGTAQVEVRRGGSSELRVVLPPAAEIGGLVTGPDGPIGAARVTLRDGEWERAVETGSDGRFRFPEARTNWCEITAEARDHRPAGVRVGPGLAGRFVRLDLRAQVDEFPLRVEDELGRPVAGATVTVSFDGGVNELDGVVRCVTDATGFARRLPRSPRATVSVVADGFSPWGLTLPWQLTEEYVVRLRREACIEVRLAADVDASEGAAWTVGLARWNRPRSEEDAASYESFRDRYGSVRDQDWVGFDHEGRARFRGAHVEGTYAVLARRRDTGGVPNSFRVVAWTTESLPAGTTVVDWTPPALAPVRIRVEHGAAAAPLAAYVRFEVLPGSEDERKVIEQRGYSTSTRTGSGGTGIAWVWPGRYRVEAYAGHGISHEPRADAEVEVGSEGASVTLRIASGSPVRGRLRSSDGTPLAGRQVHLNGEPDAKGARLLLFARTDDGGRFEVPHAPDGDYGIWVQTIRGEMAAPTPARVTAPAGEVELVVTGHTLRGDVRPVPEGLAVVRLSTEYAGVVAEAHVDETGQFEFTGLAPGQKKLTVYKLGLNRRMLAQASATIPDDARINIVVPPLPAETEPR